MAEALAGKALTSFVEGAISSNLTALASKEVGLLLGVREEVSYLIVELEMMKALLRSVEEKQETDIMVRVWVRCLRETSLDMEDCLDKFDIWLKRHPSRNLLDWFAHQLRFPCTLRARHEIAAEIQYLKKRIGYISECRLRYGVTATASDSSNLATTVGSIANHRLDALFVQESQLVGIDKPREKLIDLLMSDEKQRRVLAVLGMGGLGKTTLAKKVYESLQVAGGFFDCRAWIAVSQTFNLSLLLREIIKQVSSKMQKEEMQSRGDLITELRNLLQEKRYIVVLDDIWSIDAWESIKNALPDNNNGSRVVVTTRIEEVAINCCSGARGINQVYKLQLLSKDESIKLFKNRVFGTEKNCPEHLEKVIDDIAIKCGGLPLAIVAISGVLANMENNNDVQQWTNLLNNLPSALETNPSLEGMKKVLLLSYNHLPYLLKPCFLYLSIFPEDHLIKRKQLIQLWVAQGLVTNHYEMSAEVMAEYYFNDLVGRSLVLPSAVDWNGKVKGCRIHDIMLEVLVSKSREENMVSILSKQSGPILSIVNVNRRLSYQGETSPIICVPEDVDLSRVRSLSAYGCTRIPTFFPRLRLLRVLVIENYENLNTEQCRSFDRVLSKLWHLRYLSLKGTYVRFFPMSVSKLQNMETLDLRDIYISSINISFAKLRRLRHLLMGTTTKGVYVISKFSDFKFLKDLQTLVGLMIHNTKIAVELRHLTQLKKLSINIGIPYSKEPSETLNSLCDSLDKLSESLLSLSIISSDRWDKKMNLENSKSPPFLLQRLKLVGNWQLPYFLGSLSNLAKLTLSIKAKDWVNDLDIIKTLPNMLFLCLTNSGPQKLLFSRGGFGNLKTLKIFSIHTAEIIEFQDESMPVLQKLIISKCMSLTQVIGIEFLKCLNEIQLEHVPGSVAEVLKSNAESHTNIPKLTGFAFSYEAS